MKILFITSNRVGDAVLSTGVLAWLVEHYPDAEFTIACGPYAAGLFRAVPRLERLIVLEKKTWNRHWLELWQACIGTRWNLIVDLRNSIVSRLLRAEKRVSASGSTGKHKVIENAAILTQLQDTTSRKDRSSPLPLVGRVRVGGHQQGQSSQIEDGHSPHSPHPNPPHKGEGICPAPASPPSPFLWLDEKAEQETAKLLPATRPLLALAPGANWPCKQWPIERFAELAKKLTATDGPLPNAPVVVIAEPHERDAIRPLLQSIPSNRLIEIIGRDLLTVAACLKQCALFVGNDSGLMHVAAAMGTPTLGLFGPGFEEIYGPWGPHGAVVRTPESREELLARLPSLNVREPNLMTGLSVEMVYAAAIKLLEKVKF